ncbi:MULTISPECIES: restriction endonuclease subunit S [unclassified Rathayibacter]|uniref:restriction endonuclease subunit S n=1 Tax=unclassified Rathayibacter TaxID=2609250 RepID=UPI000CE86389|nr:MULTISPECIES: restriction endonuclease subunit S [unclassified Rathayibacter]PPF28426.1 hypothetical protein C5C54_06850 [Rathayibacter sp. AY1F2]PPH48364.1 hypothetical protein C5C42_02045 [Rathayibacter sp. AY1F7]
MTIETVPLLESLTDISAGNQKIPASAFLAAGELAVVDQSKKLVGGWTNDGRSRVSAPGPVIVFGDHTRILKYIDFPFAIGADGVKVLRPGSAFDAKYLYYFLTSQNLPNAGYSRHFKYLKEIRVPKPPLREQRRIAAILDRAEALPAKRREVLAHLDSLPQSVFLTLFGDPDMASEKVPFSKIASLSGGRNLVADDLSAETPYRVLKISAVTTGQFRPSESKPLPLQYQPPIAHFVRAGDLLMSRANTAELVGAVAHVSQVADNLVLPDKIWRFEWHEAASVPVFYRALFQSRTIRHRISRMSSGTGGSMKNISKEKIADLMLPAVSFAEQQSFARHIEAIEAHRAESARALAMEDELFASAVARAFRGEL